jgi:hypothetical protein
MSEVQVDIGYGKIEQREERRKDIKKRIEIDNKIYNEFKSQFENFSEQKQFSIKKEMIELSKQKFGIYWKHLTSQQICFVEVMKNKRGAKWKI